VRVRLLRYLLAVGLIAGTLLLLVGCGGGGQQNGQSKSSKAEQTTQKASGKEKTNTKQEAHKWHAFKGTVTSVLPDKHNLTVKRNNGKAKTFTYEPDKVKVKQNGNKAGPDAIKKGQHVHIAAQGNIAHSIRIRSEQSGASGGETTGG
jgi:hypothetical protein